MQIALPLYFFGSLAYGVNVKTVPRLSVPPSYVVP